MQLKPIKRGDVVQIDRDDMPFMAEVTQSVNDLPNGTTAQTPAIGVMPMHSGGNGYRSATARQVIGHWKATKATHRRRGTA